ncbi:uncharacterized protein METZ01_LOCUS281937 [marine metagenome]|uniref:Uncharacterized protein n=1 Tax=marine metagenome TaxID=408172 RepID=A0A382KZZ1_9ZZZZ
MIAFGYDLARLRKHNRPWSNIYEALKGQILTIGSEITMEVTGFRDP